MVDTATRRAKSRSLLLGLGLSAFALTITLHPHDADAQRRRRRHNTSHPTHTDEQPDTTASPAPEPVAPPPVTAPPPPPIEPTVTTQTQIPEDTHATLAMPWYARAPVIDFQVGFRMQGRSFWFVDDLFQRLRPYNLTAAPAIAGALEFYPGAFAGNGPASMIGIVASGEYVPLLASRDALGNSFPTTAYAFSAGLRGRYRFRNIEIGATAAYVRQSFTIEGANRPDGIPNVTYQSVRLGLGGRIDVTERVAIMASGAYLLVLDTGEIGTAAYFPHATAGGVEAGLGAAYRIVSGLEVRLNLDWRRYFLGMHSVPEDQPQSYVAGGAADDYFSATIGVAFRR